jgi:serine/threonine protein kinase
MDIKPQNVLVRQFDFRSYKVYIADVDIARAYKSSADSETGPPVAYTRTYAAPEVIEQDKRDFSADIFSLGSVFT